MKLNKVLALALSGVMAVSMLAGCKGGSANGEQDNTEQPPVASNAVSVMNNLQSKVEFKADTNMDAAFAAALDGLVSADISGAPASVTQIKNGAIYNAVQAKLPGSYKLGSNVTFATQPTNDADTTITVLYWVKAANLSEENVLTLVADALNVGTYYDQGYTGTAGSYKYYKLDYTGAVSIEKVSKTSEAGTTYSAYVVAVSMTRSYGDQVKA